MRLPPSPSFITAIGRPRGRAISRRASWSGQRQNASIVDILPSVSESPSVTMPPVSALASTSTPQTKNQSLVRLAIGITCASAEITRRRDIVGLPRIAPGDLRIVEDFAGQIEADRKIGQRRQIERDRIAEQNNAGRYRRRRRDAKARLPGPAGRHRRPPLTPHGTH